MLKEEFKNQPEYKVVIERLEKIENPITFYNMLKKMNYGEYIADIKFMYDSAQNNLGFLELARELGVENEVEDYTV